MAVITDFRELELDEISPKKHPRPQKGTVLVVGPHGLCISAKYWGPPTLRAKNILIGSMADDYPEEPSGFPSAFWDVLDEPLPAAGEGIKRQDTHDAEIVQLQRENAQLRGSLTYQLTRRRVGGSAILSSLFFSGALTAQAILGIPLIHPAVGWVGLSVSLATLLLSHLAKLGLHDLLSSEEIRK